jgi:hypothetical protein
MPPEFIDPLDWYRRDFREARIRGDEKRQELARVFDLFASNQRQNLEQAIQYLHTGRQIAIERDQPFWELLFDYWLYTCTARPVGDVDEVTRLFMKANKAAYRECPIIGRIYTALIEAYVWEDPISYASHARQAIDYTITNLPLSEESYLRIMVSKLRLHYELQEYELINQAARTVLHYSEAHVADTLNTYIYVAQARAALGDYSKAMDSAILALKLGEWKQSIDWQRAALTVQSAIRAREGNKQDAEVIRDLIRGLEMQGAKWLDSAFDAELDYWRYTGGFWNKLFLVRFAKLVRDYYIKEGQVYWDCRSRLILIETFAEIPSWIRWLYLFAVGMPSLKEQVEEAQFRAQNLKNPEWYLDRLSKVAAKFMV